MIYAPTSRYAKAVRVLVPIAALFGLGYLFLVTFVPDHLLSISTATDQRSYYAGLLKLRSHSNDDEQRLGQQYRRNIQQAHLDMGENEEDLRNAHRGHLGNDIGTRKTEMKLETSSLDPNSAHTGYGIYDSNQNTLLTAPIIGRANGVLVMVIDEQTPGQLQKARETIRHMEDRFNRGRNYPWILLSPAPLSDRAKTLTKFLSNAPIYYSAIAKEHWRLPKWIDPSKVITNDYDLLKFKGLNRTELLTRHRWRFTSGILASLDLMDEFEFFWRIEPGIEIFCDMNDDPMLEMKKSGQKFAFSTSWAQIESGLPSAWSTIQAFKNTHPDLLPEKNDEAFLTRESGDAFAACSYGTQNSIARVDFFRSPRYRAIFDFVDQLGLFYYEKWTDDVMITVGLSLFGERSEVLFLKQLGWRLDQVYGNTLMNMTYCPRATGFHEHCHCDPYSFLAPTHISCTSFWLKISRSPKRKERLECMGGKCHLYFHRVPLF